MRGLLLLLVLAPALVASAGVRARRCVAYHRRHRIVSLLAPALLLSASCGWEPSYPLHGRDLYSHYCASCHGLEGRGDGPAAAALSPPPSDLTRSKARVPRLMRIIDGRRTVRAHGTAAMPVWGEVFEQSLIGESRQRRQALEQVRALAEYVRYLRASARRTRE